MTLLDGFHTEDPEEGIETPAAEVVSRKNEGREGPVPAFGVAELFGRPGLPRRILELKLQSFSKSRSPRNP